MQTRCLGSMHRDHTSMCIYSGTHVSVGTRNGRNGMCGCVYNPSQSSCMRMLPFHTSVRCTWHDLLGEWTDYYLLGFPTRYQDSGYLWGLKNGSVHMLTQGSGTIEMDLDPRSRPNLYNNGELRGISGSELISLN